MNYTESEIKAHLKNHKTFIEFVHPIFNKYLKAKGKAFAEVDDENIWFDDDMVRGAEYGFISTATYAMPISILWEPDLIEAIDRERIKKEEDKKEKAEETKRLAKEEKDKAEYERLKKKFGGE
jgi:hypothetical protein